MRDKIILALLIWATILNGSLAMVYLEDGNYITAIFNSFVSLFCSFILVANTTDKG